jgi:cytochrome c oxidase accessory protein FixG
MTNRGLDPERLSSLDDHGHRKQMIPGEVRGFYRRRRTQVQAVLIFIFLFLPWIPIGGQQAILLDVGARRFLFFGLELYAHDAPLIFFLIATLAIGLAFMTAVWGRVWCGWACPQTVFIDGVFRRIEFWTEGNYLERRKMARSPLSPIGFARKVLKWILFVLTSSLIAHSFAAYFVGGDRLLRMMYGSPTANWSYFVMISAVTLLILFDFAWFREQFCIIMCPYGRFQGLLMDRKSLAVLYDESRGEPRRGLIAPEKKQGDCVACNRCVEVCPTGIDIRQGLQMECINCTACMDACDEIMTKVQKPKKLIRLASLDGKGWTLKSPRALLYLALLVLLTAGLSISIAIRSPVDMVVLRVPGELYQELSGTDGQPGFINHLKLHLKNQTGQTTLLRISARSESAGELELTTAVNPLPLLPGEDRAVHLFIRFQRDILDEHGENLIKIKIENQIAELPFQVQKSYRLLGPSR